MREPTELELRVAQVQGVMIDWIGRPFAWGKADCAHLAADLLVARGRTTTLGAAERYRSHAGARRALRRQGHASLAAAVDAQGVARIAPAAAYPGDLVGLPGEAGMTALFVAVGNGRVLGFFDGECRVGQPLLFDAAWRT